MDEQLSRLQFERADLLKRLDEDQDDLNDLMQKHKDLIAQVATESGRRLGGLGPGRREILPGGCGWAPPIWSEDLGGVNATRINRDCEILWGPDRGGCHP